MISLASFTDKDYRTYMVRASKTTKPTKYREYSLDGLTITVEHASRLCLAMTDEFYGAIYMRDIESQDTGVTTLEGLLTSQLRPIAR